MPFPLARTDQLVIQELPDETLVFDQRSHKAHCLNRTTALVWKHCDGKTDPADLALLFECEPHAGVLVQLALEQLASRDLLQTAVERGSPAQRRSRREVLKQLAAAAVTLPVILTVAAPRANAAGSPVTCNGKADETSCGSSGQQCCKGACISPGALQSSCTAACQCPNGIPCSLGKCCLPEGAPCTTSKQCCSNSCDATSLTCFIPP
jgi:hypothetical protein